MKSLAVAATVVLAVACVPVVEGPQIAAIPDGLGYINTIQSFGSMLPGLTLVRQVGYWEPAAGDHPPGYVDISEFAETIDESRAQAIREARAERQRDALHEPLETTKINGWPAYLWRSSYSYGGQQTPTLSALVVSPRRTYFVSFTANREDWKDPAYMRRVVTSFTVRSRADVDIPIVFGLVSAITALVYLAWRFHHAPKRHG